jgi:ABC-2 type transport system ATP-binding protein
MIRAQALTKRYRRNEALHGASFHVPEGSVFALIGPNGAGKSTAIKTLMNIIQPSGGSAEVLGVDSRRLGPAELAQIGYVSENQRLPEWMRVDYFLDYCRPLYPTWDTEAAAQLVREFGLPLDRRLRELSRGMKMKAALAASLAYNPRLIVLDEPFSGLDVLVREELIASLAERTPAATILIASHDLGEIENVATHAAYLNEGRVEFVEEMAHLTERFREVEVTLEEPAVLPGGLPAAWLNVEASAASARFADSAYDAEATAAEIRRRFTAVRNIEATAMSFRAIFIALAKSHRRSA